MAVPSMPRPRFAMIEPEIGFGPLEAFFDGPAQACDAGELGERRVGGDKAKIIGSLGWSAPVASDQDKALEAAVACPGQADLRPVVESQSLGAFASSVSGPGFGIKRVGQHRRIGLLKAALARRQWLDLTART